MRVKGLILLFVIWVKVRVEGIASAGFLPALLSSVGRTNGSLVATGAGNINAREGMGHRVGKEGIGY